VTVLAITQRARANRDVKDIRDNCVTTFGQVFADGTMIELVSGTANQANLLLYSNRTKHTSGPRVKYGSCIYEAPRLDPVLLGATRLPRTFAEYGSLRDLVAKIADQFRKLQNFAEQESKLLAAFALTTWVSDRLSLAPSLVICGPDQAVNAMRLLSCFCRRPLMLGDVTAAGLRNLPLDLRFSLLLNQPVITRGMRQMLGASGHRGLYIVGNRGKLLDLFCPRVILSAMDTIDDFSDQSIQVHVEPAQISDTIDERLQCEIADEFQPQLLMYRLRNCAKIQVIGADVLDLAIPTRQLAGNLAACFAEDLELAHELISLLRPQDQDLRAKQAGNIECVILKIIIGLIHGSRFRLSIPMKCR